MNGHSQIGADGAQSRVRLLTGISCHGFDYQQLYVHQKHLGLVLIYFAHLVWARGHSFLYVLCFVSGVVATVQTEAPHSTAWQRFLPTGPLALLPVRLLTSSGLWLDLDHHFFLYFGCLSESQSYGSYSSIVWSTNAAHAQRLSKLDSNEFIEELNFALMATPRDLSPQFSSAYAHAFHSSPLLCS
jgi:hypothetical protein